MLHECYEVIFIICHAFILLIPNLNRFLRLQIPKNSIGLGMEMFNALPFLVGENNNEPVLYLVPKFSPLYGYRLPVSP